jgi:hypothetical protein
MTLTVATAPFIERRVLARRRGAPSSLSGFLQEAYQKRNQAPAAYKPWLLLRFAAEYCSPTAFAAHCVAWKQTNDLRNAASDSALSRRRIRYVALCVESDTGAYSLIRAPKSVATMAETNVAHRLST